MKLSVTMIQGLMLVMLVVTISGFKIENTTPFDWENVGHMRVYDPPKNLDGEKPFSSKPMTKTYLIKTVDHDVNPVIFISKR